MLSSVEQAFVGRDEKRAPLKTSAWEAKPHERLACCSTKGVPSFLGYFKTLGIGPAPGIEPPTSRSAVNTLYRLS